MATERTYYSGARRGEHRYTAAVFTDRSAPFAEQICAVPPCRSLFEFVTPALSVVPLIRRFACLVLGCVDAI